LQNTLEVPKLAFEKLAFSTFFHLDLGMITWGVGAIPLNMQAKLECDENLALMIEATRIGYAKTFKGVWMKNIWKFASNNTMRHKIDWPPYIIP